MRLRISTGLVLAAIVVGLLFLGPLPFFVLAVAAILVALEEFYAMARKAGYAPATALGLVGGAALMIGVYQSGPGAAPFIIVVTVVCAGAWFVVSRNRSKMTANLSMSMFGLVYVAFLASFIGPLVKRPDRVGVTLIAIGAGAAYDVFALAGGRAFGRHQMATGISPGKTWEGAFVGTVGIIGTSALVTPLLGPFTVKQAIIIGVVGAIVAPLGDLTESMIKRDFGVKDSGSIVPGHGGLLDRLDAILFAIPAVWFLMQVFGV